MPNQIKAGADAPRRPELRIVAFEPFDRGSHRAVRESISRHSHHQWRWLTRPGRAWKWRMRLAAVELVEEAADGGFFEPPVDAIFATSLMSAADLRALLPAGLRGTPVILYMHENQAAYPDPESQERDVHFALTNLTSILAADLTVWNSDFNRRSFVDGIESLLRHAPDRLPGSVRERVEQRSTVIWPPVEPPPEATAASGNPDVLHNSIRVVWPHRWEHDKGPGELLAAAREHTDRLDLRWTILGERFGQTPSELAEFERGFADRLDHFGYVADRDEYWRLLQACDWVLSTARHEFFGIAVVEAMLAGCLPWLPDRLSYPELLPPEVRQLSPANPPADPERVRSAIRAHLEPALAANAVARLDKAIETAVAG